MKKYLVFIIITIFIFTGCGGEAPNGEIDEPNDEETVDEIEPTEPVLTQEREDSIKNHMAPYEGMVSVHEIGEINSTIVVWLDVGEEPMTEGAARGITDGIAMEIAELFNFKIPIKITAVQLSDDDEVAEFGSSIFSPETGEVEYVN